MIVGSEGDRNVFMELRQSDKSGTYVSGQMFGRLGEGRSGEEGGGGQVRIRRPRDHASFMCMV